MARGVEDLSLEEIRQRYLEKATPVSSRVLARL